MTPPYEYEKGEMNPHVNLLDRNVRQNTSPHMTPWIWKDREINPYLLQLTEHVTTKLNMTGNYTALLYEYEKGEMNPHLFTSVW